MSFVPRTLAELVGITALEAVVVARRDLAARRRVPRRVVRRVAELEAILRDRLRDYRRRRGEPDRSDDLEQLLAWAEWNLRGWPPAGRRALSVLPELPRPDDPPALTDGGMP